MLATNFDDISLPAINELLKFVLENKYSDFYRKKYENLGLFSVASHEDFQKIPFLTKDEILETAIEKRTFVSSEKIFRYSFSSGTSKNSVPTIVPHEDSDVSHFFYDTNLRELGVSKLLLFLPPNHGLVRSLLHISDTQITFISGDIHNPKLMANIVDSLKIEGVVTTPTLLDMLLDSLKTQNFDFNTIKWISLGSEFCSTVRYDYFRAALPNASFKMRYGISEFGVGRRHYRCKYLDESASPSTYHTDSSIELIEIIDENGNILPMEETGEIVATDLRQKAFPLLRYRLKDMGSLSRKICPCGNNIQLKIDGRAGYDILKIHGLTLYAELIEKAINSVDDILEQKYQMHISEEIHETKPKLKFQLHVILKQSSSDKKEDAFLYEFLREKVSSKLFLSSKMTLKQLTEEGFVLPLEIKFVDGIKTDNGKAKRIISHIA